MHGYGASAPAGALYKHFGFTVEAIVEAASACMVTCAGKA
jgi:transketolase